LKERDELTSEGRTPATQEAKDEFLNNVDLLTEKGYVSDCGYRINSYDLQDGRKVELTYYSEKAMAEVESVDDPTKAQMNLLEPVDADRFRMRCCYLKRGGNLEQHTSVRDLKKMREQAMGDIGGLPRSDDEYRKELEQLLEEVRHTMKSMEQAAQLGLAFVSEADLKAFNEILRVLIDKQKKKEKK